MKKRYLHILLISMLVVFTACSNRNNASVNVNVNENIEESKPTIAVSIVPQETFVKAVAGDLVDVVTMIPPGNSPANYQPTPKLMQSLSDSDLYFTIGVPTEKANILPKVKDLAEEIKIIQLEDKVNEVYKPREFSKGQRDPHIWLSPKRAILMINTIKDELSEIDSENKSVYETNANSYIEKLNQLDEDIKDSLENAESKTFIVYHPSFGYFADDYGLEMISLEKNGKEATPKDIENVIDLAKEKKIKVIFYQAEIDSSQSRVIADEIGGNVEMIEPLAPNYIENLQKTVTIFRKSFEK